MRKVDRIKCTCGHCGKVFYTLECRVRRGRGKFCSRQCSGAVNGVTHGRTYAPAYNSWVGMRARCGNPNFPAFARYGGRGIRVCERWQKFENFLADMGDPPLGHSLDRIDPNGNYEPENCRWATHSEQLLNRRGTKRFPFQGKMLPLKTISDLTGISRYTLEYRYGQGWSEDALFSKPTARKPRSNKAFSRPPAA